MMLSSDELIGLVGAANRIWLFLDYDGTLVDFSPTPDIVEPHPEVIDVLNRAEEHPRIRLAVISGRRLEHIEKLLPIPGLTLAGTYGIELRTERGDRIERIPYENVRPSLERLKPTWENLLSDGEGFYLEDKGWSLALHARFVEDARANEIITRARKMTTDVVDSELFQVLGGHKFLEVAPLDANKGKTVKYLLQRSQWKDALLLYIGDDDKDEEAFKVIKSQGGIPIVVAKEPRESEALYRLESPEAVLAWVESMLSQVPE